MVDLERAKYSSTKVVCLNQKGLDKVEQLRGLLNEIELILLDEWGKEEVLHFQNQLDKILSTLNEQVS